MLNQDRVKTTTVHTRKEVIAIFEEFRTKINNAYESESQEAFQSLLSVVRIIYYLYPLPRFLQEINSVGTIPLTVFLQNLLIKTRMVKLQICQYFRNWIISLILEIKNLIPSFKLEDIKQFKQLKEYHLENRWIQAEIIEFISYSLYQAVSKSDSGLVAVFVFFLRNIIVFCEQNGMDLVKEVQGYWDSIVSSLAWSCRILDNLKRQETNVCICYFLCLKNIQLCQSAIQSRIVDYQISLLSNRFMVESFGKKIIQFLKYLLIHSDQNQVQTISIQQFEQSLSLFATKFNREAILSSVRELVNLFQKRMSGINHQSKLLALSQLYEREQNSSQLLQNLYILNLYIHNQKMASLIVKYYHKLLSKIVVDSSNPSVVMLVINLLSFAFSNAKFDISVAALVVEKIEKIITNSQLRESLIENKKQLLIDYVKIIKRLLQNREHFDKIARLIQLSKLESKLWLYSDCTTFLYERELIDLNHILGTKQNSIDVQRQLVVLSELQADLVTNAKSNIGSKLSWELYEQIKFLEHLIAKNQHQRQQIQHPSQLIPVVSNFIHFSSSQGQVNLLGNLQTEEGEEIRKEINFISCKLLTELLHSTDIDPELKNKATKKLVDLSASYPQIEDTYDIVNNFFKRQPQALKMHQNNHNYNQRQVELQVFRKVAQQLVVNYFVQNSNFDINLLRFNDHEQLLIVMQIMEQYQSLQNLSKYLKLTLELTRKQLLCPIIYQNQGQKFTAIYKCILQNKESPDIHSIQYMESILYRFIKYHINAIFNDNLQGNEISFWSEIVNCIELYFEVGFSREKIHLFEAILQYFQLNGLEIAQAFVRLFANKSRRQFMKEELQSCKGSYLGQTCAYLLSLNPNEQEQQTFLIHQKQSFDKLIRESKDNNQYLRFFYQFITICHPFVFQEYQLDSIIQFNITQMKQEIERIEMISSNLNKGTLKLRKLKHIGLILKHLNERNDIIFGKNLILYQQEVLITCIIKILHIRPAFEANQFKKYFIQKLIIQFVCTLNLLYKQNYKHLAVKGDEIIDKFESILEIDDDSGRSALCELMLIYLLKGSPKMRECSCLVSCKQYSSSLPALAQEHIQSCERAEYLQAVNGNFQQEFDKYFPNSINNREKSTPDPEHSLQMEYNNELLNIFNHEKQQIEQHELRLNKRDTIELKQPLYYQFESKDQKAYQKTIESISIAEQKQTIISEKDSKAAQKQQSWSNELLLQNIKQILNPPYSTGIKTISKHLTTINSQQFYNLLTQIFLRAKKLFEQDLTPTTETLEQIQHNIILYLPEEFCEQNKRFYQVMSHDLIGSQICHKRKGIGMKGIQILTAKLLNSIKEDEFSIYSLLLAQNLEREQLKYIKNCKVYQAINYKLPLFINNQRTLANACKLITKSCELSQIRSFYQVSDILIRHITESSSLQSSTQKCILAALNALILHNQKHSQSIEFPKIVVYISKLLEKEQLEYPQYAANILLNAVENNQIITQIYQETALQQKIIKLLRQFIDKKQFHKQIFIPLLGILKLLAQLPQSSVRILKAKFMILCKDIFKLVQKIDHQEVIEFTILILSSMIDEMELNLTRVIEELEKDGLIEYLYITVPTMCKSKNSEPYLDIFCKILAIPNYTKRCLSNQKQIIKMMSQISKHHSLSLMQLQKWMKILFHLLETQRYSSAADILKSNIFFCAASSLKISGAITQNTLIMNNRIIRQLNAKNELSSLLVIHGFADFMVHTLKMSNLPLNDYVRIVELLTWLQSRKGFPRALCSKLFEILVQRLETKWNEDISVGSIALLRKIKRSVEVTSEFGSSILQFFNHFIALSNKISSSQYYNISRQILCLLSFYIVFNEDLKILFNNKKVVETLKNWHRIAKALEYNQIPPTYKLFLYSIYNNQNLTIDTCDINNKKLQSTEATFEKGWKCNLYRLNGSYKNAIIRFDKGKKEVCAFKYPDGEVKAKYRLPLKNILILCRYREQKNVLFEESRFRCSSNIFQHTAPFSNCLTLLGLTEEDEVREISIEFEQISQLEEVYLYTKILISKILQADREEELSIWNSANNTRILS